MRKAAQAVLLLLVGGTLLKICITGSYVRYVKPGLSPLLLVAGAVLVLVAAVTLWQVGQAQGLSTPAARRGGASPATAQRHDRDGHDRGGHDRDGHEQHGHDKPGVGWLLLLPMLALLLFAPPALGSYQASRNGTALSARAGSEFAPLAVGDPVRLSVLDYASRAVFDEGRSLAGRRVVLSGFVIDGPQAEVYLARLVVGCCAADAKPIKVGLAGKVPADPTWDTWIEVEGTYVDRVGRDAVNDDPIPYLQVAESRAIPAPDREYES